MFHCRLLYFRNLLLAVSVLVMHCAFSQDELTELNVDRPGIADKPFTVPKGMYQFEVGFDYFCRTNGQYYDLPVGMLRAGISKRSEIRISSKQLVDHTDGHSQDSFSPLSVGIKMHINQQHKHFPEMDIAANFVVPVSPASAQSKKLGYEFLLLFQNDFYPNTAINYNIGYIWDSNRGTNILSASFCFDYLPTRRVGLFIEYYGFVQSGLPDEHGIDGGITYLLVHNLQLDLSGGTSLLEGKSNFFISSGFSLRIGKRAAEKSLSGSAYRSPGRKHTPQSLQAWQ